MIILEAQRIMISQVLPMNKIDVVNKLKELRYIKLSEAYAKVINSPNTYNKPFNELLMLMLSYEDDLLKNNKIKQFLKQTNQAVLTSLEDIDYNSSRNIPKELIRNLSNLDFIKNAHNIIVTGPTGTGKTFIATAFGFACCKSPYNVIYYRLPVLLDEISIRRDKGNYKKFIRKLIKIDLLIIDDLGLSSISINESREILEILEERNRRKSVILVSQLPFNKWYEMFKDPTIADAIIDRIAYNSYKIELKGESMRKVKNAL